MSPENKIDRVAKFQIKFISDLLKAVCMCARSPPPPLLFIRMILKKYFFFSIMHNFDSFFNKKLQKFSAWLLK